MAGSVSWWRVPDMVTSNASTTMRGELEAAFCWPVTSIVSVWVVSARPFCTNTSAWICSVGEYVSTGGCTTPSRVTRAIPVCGVRAPIQLIPVPVKVKVACAPGAVENAAIPALHAWLVSPIFQLLKLKLTSGSVSCRRETVTAGASNASTTMKVSSAAAFFRPVTSIVRVWLVLARPDAVYMDTRISSVFEYVSTSARKVPSTDTRAMPVPRARPPIQVTEVPVKVNVAWAPCVVENAALPPLHDLLASDVHPPLGVSTTDGSVSSKRAPDPAGGGGGGALLATVTVTGAEVVWLPAASRAMAVMVCDPSVAVAVFHETEYGGVVASALPLTPLSKRNCTPTTPTLSAASAVTLIVSWTVAPEAGDVMLTVGGVVSAGGGALLATVTVTGAEVNDSPSRPSRATAVSVCVPLPAVVVFEVIEYGAEVSRAPRSAPSSWNCTLETVSAPTMLTLALTGIAPPTVEPEAGDVMVTIRLPTGSGGSSCAKA